MKKGDLLQKYYDMACHNLLCYSANFLMEEPKRGFEAEWEQSKNECDLMQEILNQLPHWNTKEFSFIGTISSLTANFSNVNEEQFMESLIVSDKDDNNRMFDIEYEAGKELLRTYDEERHRRYDIGKDTEIVFTVSNTFQCIESWNWKVE